MFINIYDAVTRFYYSAYFLTKTKNQNNEINFIYFLKKKNNLKNKNKKINRRLTKTFYKIKIIIKRIIN